MTRLLHRIDRIQHKGGHWLHDLWLWTHKGAVGKRLHAARKWFQHHENWARAHRLRKRAAWFAKKHTIYRRVLRKWRKHHRHTGELHYSPILLNGHSSNIADELKPVVAFVVLARHQAVTDTYDYGGHANGSWHYPSSDPTPPPEGHAIDSAGPDMCGSMQATEAKFGAGYFLELFGPCSYYVKNGGKYPGMFPGHGDHQHSAAQLGHV